MVYFVSELSTYEKYQILFQELNFSAFVQMATKI